MESLSHSPTIYLWGLLVRGKENDLKLKRFIGEFCICHYNPFHPFLSRSIGGMDSRNGYSLQNFDQLLRTKKIYEFSIDQN